MSNKTSRHQDAQPIELPNQTSGTPPLDPAGARAWQRLSCSPYREFCKVNCSMHDGVLVLQGEVSSFYLKQVAQEIARQTEGIETIANRLEVHGKSH